VWPEDRGILGQCGIWLFESRSSVPYVVRRAKTTSHGGASKQSTAAWRQDACLPTFLRSNDNSSPTERDSGGRSEIQFSITASQTPSFFERTGLYRRGALDSSRGKALILEIPVRLPRHALRNWICGDVGYREVAHGSWISSNPMLWDVFDVVYIISTQTLIRVLIPVDYISGLRPRKSSHLISLSSLNCPSSSQRVILVQK
jgi:hypothetical protein